MFDCTVTGADFLVNHVPSVWTAWRAHWFIKHFLLKCGTWANLYCIYHPRESSIYRKDTNRFHEMLILFPLTTRTCLWEAVWGGNTQPAVSQVKSAIVKVSSVRNCGELTISAHKFPVVVFLTFTFRNWYVLQTKLMFLIVNYLRSRYHR
jgi:hypothetical protein